MRKARVFALILTISTLAGRGVAEKNGDAPAAAATALEGFDDLVNQALKDFKTPGAAIAVVRGNEVIYTKGFGFRDVEAGKPVTPDTLFGIGSVTKSMTAAVVGTLVDEGLVDWDAPVRTYLPYFKLSDPGISERVTLRDMLTHRTGLPRHDMLWLENSADLPRDSIVRRLAHLEMNADLRQRHQYNNLMFVAAGHVAGQATGRTWEQLIQERIFEPLGMTRSNTSVAEMKADDNFSCAYFENEAHEIERCPILNSSVLGPAGSVNTSVREMARWLLMNMHGGSLEGKQVIGASTLAQMHTPQILTALTRPHPEISADAYGLGWFIGTYRGKRRIEHGGGAHGFVTACCFFPDDDLGLVCINNGSTGISKLINRHAADRLLGLEPIDWLRKAKERREKRLANKTESKEMSKATRVAGTQPSHNLEAYRGEYLHAGYGKLKVDLEGNALSFTYHDATYSLEHWHYDVWNATPQVPFFGMLKDYKVLFRGNVDGDIAAVEIQMEEMVAPIVFEKQPDARLSDPAYLSRFEGEYVMNTGDRFTVSLSGRILTAEFRGSPVFHLEPNLSGRFVAREYQVFSFEFVEGDGQKARRARFHKPGMVIEAERQETPEDARPSSDAP